MERDVLCISVENRPEAVALCCKREREREKERECVCVCVMRASLKWRCGVLRVDALAAAMCHVDEARGSCVKVHANAPVLVGVCRCSAEGVQKG